MEKDFAERLELTNSLRKHLQTQDALQIQVAVLHHNQKLTKTN